MPRRRSRWGWRSSRCRSGGASSRAGRLAEPEDAAPVGRRKAELVWEEAERAQLLRRPRRARTAQYLALRAKIVLRCAEGGTTKQAAADLGQMSQ
jgi:hypothetical protein